MWLSRMLRSRASEPGRFGVGREPLLGQLGEGYRSKEGVYPGAAVAGGALGGLEGFGLLLGLKRPGVLTPGAVSEAHVVDPPAITFAGSSLDHRGPP